MESKTVKVLWRKLHSQKAGAWLRKRIESDLVDALWFRAKLLECSSNNAKMNIANNIWMLAGRLKQGATREFDSYDVCIWFWREAQLFKERYNLSAHCDRILLVCAIQAWI